jgi:predicted O-methyltransferase YrrM
MKERMMKPIFDGEFIAFSMYDRYALNSLVKSLDKENAVIAEVGSWMGNGSTTTMIEALKGTDSLIYCVDHWRGNENVQRHQDIVANYDVFNTFRYNILQCDGEGLVRPMMMSSEEAAAVLADGVFDLVFIDGDHSYEAVSRDIALWRPKVAQGGVLCGHDCRIRPDKNLRDYLWEKRHDDMVPVDHEFHPRVHAGVVLAVYEAFGDEVHLWGEEEVEAKDGTVGRSSVWDIRV